MRSLWKGHLRATELATSRKEAYVRPVALSSVAFPEKWAKDVQKWLSRGKSSEVGDVPQASVPATACRGFWERKRQVPVRLYFILSMPGDYWNLKLYFEITLDGHKVLRKTELSHCPSHCVAYCMTSIRTVSSQGVCVCCAFRCTLCWALWRRLRSTGPETS